MKIRRSVLEPLSATEGELRSDQQSSFKSLHLPGCTFELGGNNNSEEAQNIAFLIKKTSSVDSVESKIPSEFLASCGTCTLDSQSVADQNSVDGQTFNSNQTNQVEMQASFLPTPLTCPLIESQSSISDYMG